MGMRLDHVCDLDLGYRSDHFFPQGFVLVTPYEGGEGTGYGEGDGTATGERVRGTVRWSNHPHARSDGTMLPDAHGVIRTEDGADITFELRGRSVLSEDGNRRGQNLAAVFEAQDDRYRWLNDTPCVAEGVIDTQTLRMHIKVYSCANELV